MAIDNPISKPLRKEARTAIHNLSLAQEMIAFAKAAGMPCDEHDERCKHLKGVLMSIIQVYGEDRPQLPNEEK